MQDPTAPGFPFCSAAWSKRKGPLRQVCMWLMRLRGRSIVIHYLLQGRRPGIAGLPATAFWCARARAASQVVYRTVFDTQARRPATPNKSWLAPHATAATARARLRARASCSSAPSASPTSCRAAERRVVRGVQSGGRGVGSVGRGATITRARVLPGSGDQELVMSAMVPSQRVLSNLRVNVVV